MKRTTYSRRSLMAAAGLTLAVTLAACGGSETDNAGGDGNSGNGGQVVFANYGGSTAEAFKSAYWDPFTKETGIKVVSADADPARYVAMMQSGSSEWDTMDADGFAVASYVEKGLVEKLPSDVPRSDMVDAKYRDYSAGGYTQSFVLAYDSSALPKAPTSWADFWDTKTFPGKRGIANYYIGTAEAALLADGEAPDQLFPLDLSKAFDKWEELRGDVTISESYAAAIQALQAGSTTMALVPSGRAAVLSQQDPKFKIMWEQNIFYPWTGLTIPKGAPNAENMAKLLAFMQSPERQADFAKKSYYGPTIKAAYDLIPADVAKLLPGTPEHSATAAPIDTEELANQTDDYIKAFGDWVAQ
jgi:putative spermidine/putrescine transport system substrate-binding protein